LPGSPGVLSSSSFFLKLLSDAYDSIGVLSTEKCRCFSFALQHAGNPGSTIGQSCGLCSSSKLGGDYEPSLYRCAHLNHLLFCHLRLQR
jgi:hypothetical protein